MTLPHDITVELGWQSYQVTQPVDEMRDIRGENFQVVIRFHITRSIIFKHAFFSLIF